jgi:hypothetical protein
VPFVDEMKTGEEEEEEEEEDGYSRATGTACCNMRHELPSPLAG